MIGAWSIVFFPFAVVIYFATLAIKLSGCDPFFMLRRKVYLSGRYDDSVVVTRLHRDINGVLWAPRYAFQMSGHYVLNPKGKITGEDALYQNWSYESPHGTTKEEKIARLNARHKLT